MFENYGQYIRDIAQAALHMPARKTIKLSKFLFASLTSLLICTFALFGGQAAFAHAEMQAALEVLSAEMGDSTIVVEVNDESDTSLAAMLSDSPNNLSAKDEAAISERIRNSITQDIIANASGSFNADGILEIGMTTADGIPIVVQVVKNDEGAYSIDKIVAKLDAEQAHIKKQEISNAITSDEDKTRYDNPLGRFDDAFDAFAKFAPDTDEQTRYDAYDRQMVVLADELTMILPDNFEAQQPSSSAVGSSTEENAKTGTLLSEEKRKDIPEVKLAADRVEPYAYSYKSSDGSILSVRSENLGAAFTSMNGLDGINKMKEYWHDTATNIATGANQTLKDEQGFLTDVLYDKTSGMWGYFGYVVFSDGTRDVTYNRAVFIDELADQLITVSYRHDCAVDAGSALSAETFQSMFCTAPASGIVTGKSSARQVYEDKLYQIQILPGSDMTEPARLAKEEAERLAAEQAVQERLATLSEEDLGEDNGSGE